MADFVDIAKNFGVEAVILFAMGMFFWRVLVWLKPWAEQMFQAHISLVTTLNDTQREHGQTLLKIADTQEAQTSLLVEMKTASVKTSDILSEMRKAGGT